MASRLLVLGGPQCLKQGKPSSFYGHHHSSCHSNKEEESVAKGWMLVFQT